MAIKNLCIRESYEDKQGEQRVSWNKIGILFEANGKQYVKLAHIPGTLISVFEPRPKDDNAGAQKNNNSGEVNL